MSNLSNLPPGVSESLLPGARHADHVYEDLWDVAKGELEEAGYSANEVTALLTDRWILDAIATAAADVSAGDDDAEAQMVDRVLYRAQDVDATPRRHAIA